MDLQQSILSVVRFIEVVAFLAHQASLENLEVAGLVRDLSLSPRKSNAKETAGQLAELLRSQPVDTWKEGIAGKGSLWLSKWMNFQNISKGGVLMNRLPIFRAGHPGLHGNLLWDHLHPAHPPAL